MLPNNKDRGSKLKEKIDVVVTPPITPVVTSTPPADDNPPIETPPVNPEQPPTSVTPPSIETEFDIDELEIKKKEELTPEQLEFLKENQDFLDDEKKIKFGFKADPNPSTPPVTPKENEPDWKSRYAGSTREAQVLMESKKKLTEAIDQAAVMPAPTEEEMRKLKGEDWDMLDDAQKTIEIAREHDRRKLAHISSARDEFKKADEFVEKARTFTVDPEVLKKCPKLEGHEQEFISYCSMPTHIGVDLEVLYKAFTTELPEPVAPKRKTLLEPGNTGGAPATIKEPGYTPEQIAYMRTHDPKGYRKAIKEGKIKIDL